ncbi:transglycosylase SLT domain-containing protein [Luteimonas sp. A611]
MELMGCAELAVPVDVMHHVVRVESSFNPYAIGVVGGRLARQPRNLPEAVSTARMLEREGYNFSLGLAQVNRHNLASQGLDSYEHAFDVCPNLRAGARILADCYRRAKDDWGRALSCYYSGNFVTGFRHGYVHKVLASWNGEAGAAATPAIRVLERRADAPAGTSSRSTGQGSLMHRRMQDQTGVRVPETMRPQQVGALDPGIPSNPELVHATPMPAVPRQDDAPVLVQPMQAATHPQTPATRTEPPPRQAAPSADAAFVFQQ